MGIFSLLFGRKKEKQKQVVKKDNKPQIEVTIPTSIDGQKCAYHYTKVPVALAEGIDLDAILGQRVYFDVTYYPASVVLKGNNIGKVVNTKLADMISDWTNREEPIFAVVSRVNDDDYTAAFDLYLYRDELKYLLRRFPDAKRYKLMGNRRGEMQDNICSCERGEKCSVEYDYDKNKYTVYAVTPIGYLPAAAVKVVEERGVNNITVYVAGTSTDDEGIDEVAVYIFPKRIG